VLFVVESSTFGVGPRNFSLLQIVKPQNSPKIDLRSPILTLEKAALRIADDPGRDGGRIAGKAE
jgi:hypothetical protein